MAYDLKSMHPDDLKILLQERAAKRHKRMYSDTSSEQGYIAERLKGGGAATGYLADGKEVPPAPAIIWDDALGRYRHRTADDDLTPAGNPVRQMRGNTRHGQANNRHRSGM